MPIGLPQIHTVVLNGIGIRPILHVSQSAIPAEKFTHLLYLSHISSPHLRFPMVSSLKWWVDQKNTGGNPIGRDFGLTAFPVARTMVG